MEDPFIGTLCIFGFNFPPRGWAFCQGQILAIQQNTALFALLGTQYGGNGTTTFALPDLRGRAPVSQDVASGPMGLQEGTSSMTLITSNLPAHNHLINASSEAGNVTAPAGAYRAGTGALDKDYRKTVTGPTTVQMNPSMVGNTGSSTAFSIMQPSLAVNYSIALIGIFPSFG
ncbi:phage tail protein [Niabella hibiscisoli]|uniref:phage tail protein n=1 Tax=Niabella hibiscisoli TaxID=1825928 RepID=UPI001F10D885|nr:tail fiber protein [Niabella hibiscisoli]MCH5715923.1 tail fiber protein [Niabella hibiscisoli]